MTLATVPTSQAHPLYAPNRACVACKLHETCAGPVPGIGHWEMAALRIMFIGEGPGKREDETGEPFTGQTGTYLNSLLESIGLSRDLVYLTNLVKCRPTNNRDPKPEEVLECSGRWLMPEIMMVRPDIIVTLGAFATRAITTLDDTMEHLHGKPITELPKGVMAAPIVLPMYHPASALHAAGGEGGTARMRQVQDDFNVLKALMEGASPESFTPVDQHPSPQYWEPVDFDSLDEAMCELSGPGSFGVVAVDTEVVDGELYSVQLSSVEGVSVLVHADQWREWVANADDGEYRGGFAVDADGVPVPVVLHSYPYDAQYLDLPPNCIDTQVMAYLLGLPQSLKTLARDLCGMEMKSYEETVKPYRREKAWDYLTEAAATDWGDPETIVDLKWNNKEGRLLEKVRKPQPINKKINRILKDAAKEVDPADPWERWHKIDARERRAVEQGVECICPDAHRESYTPVKGCQAHQETEPQVGIGLMPDAGVNDLSPEEELNYSARDADATLRVYNALKPLITEAGLDNVLSMDLGILPIIREQMDTGMPVNVARLQELSAQFTETMYRKAEEAAFKAGMALWHRAEFSVGRNIGVYRFNPGSSQQVAKLIYDTVDGLGYPVTKKTDTGLPSTDDDELHKVGTTDDSGQFHMDPVIQPILDYREVLKLKGTYSEGMQRLAARSPSGRRVHAKMTTTRSETGRIIVGDGVHGIPVRTETGRQIRGAFEAEEGWTLLAADYSQVEMRVAHHIFQCKEGIKLFAEGRDIHSETAAQINGLTVEQVEADEYGLRRPAKTLGFGVLYGLTKYGLHNQMVFEGHDPEAWSPDNCDRFIQDYFTLYPELRAGHDGIKAQGRRYGYVVDMWGRRRFTPELKSPIRRIRLAGERQAINMPVQGGAQGIIKLAMIKLWERWNEERMGDPLMDTLRWLIQYHDELIFEVKIGTELQWAAILVEVMESVVELSVPIIAEAKFGPDWGHMEKIKVGASA